MRVHERMVQSREMRPIPTAATLLLLSTGCGMGWRTQYTTTCNPAARYRAAVLSNSPLSYYRLQETSTAQAATDIGSAVANGTFAGTWTFGSAGPTQDPSDVAATPDGSSGYFTATASALASGFTAESWVKLTDGTATGTNASPANPIMGNVNCGTVTQIGVEGGRFQSCRHDGGAWVCLSSTGTVHDGGWHHLVATHNQSTGAMAVFVDGQAAGTSTATYVSSGGTPFSIIGRDNTGCGANQYFSGSLDEIAVYGSVLSATTIQAHYAARLCE